MEREDFIECRTRLYDLYLQGRYSEALETAEKAYANFRDKISQTSCWLACLNSVLHREGAAIEILKTSLDNSF
jgi:hypothetical protein